MSAIRAAFLENLTIDANGVITTPGQFEGEPPYVPYFVNFVLDGSADDLCFSDGTTVSVIEIISADRELFPELPTDAEYIALEKTEQGFWKSDVFSAEGYARLQEEAEASHTA